MGYFFVNKSLLILFKIIQIYEKKIKFSFELLFLNLLLFSNTFWMKTISVSIDLLKQINNFLFRNQ